MSQVMLQEAIQAVRQGQRGRARDLLTRLLRADSSNPEYWLWMSAVVDSPKERTYCLESALKLDPGSQTARRGLALMGIAPAGGLVQPKPPGPPLRRKWETPLPAAEEAPGGKLRGRRLFAFIALAAVVVLIIAVAVAGVFGVGRRPVALRPTRTPGPPPTFTATPTNLGGERVVITPSPTFAGVTPLWALLEATYTPTPVYVNTPHPISEAYRAAQRSLARSNTAEALTFLQQAAQVEPQAADIPYHMGEIYRLQGDYEQAIAAYDRSVEVNPVFAPAYLGRALAVLGQNPRADVLADLDAALQADPALAEAYLARAAFFLGRGEVEAAQADLDQLETLLPDSPWLTLYRAQAALLQGDAEIAYVRARKAIEQDLTLLPAYLTLGQAAAAYGDFPAAKQALETYLLYAEGDAAAWLALGEARYLAAARQRPETAARTYAEALDALDIALELADDLPRLHAMRGKVFLALGEGQKAVNELMIARREQAESFPVCIELGQGLALAERDEDAAAQFTACEKLAETDADWAEIYTRRAEALTTQGLVFPAAKDWGRLLALPEKLLTSEQVATACAAVWKYGDPAAAEAAGCPPPEGATPQPTGSATPAARISPTASATPAGPSATPTRTPTRTPTPTRTATPRR